MVFDRLSFAITANLNPYRCKFAVFVKYKRSETIHVDRYDKTI